MILIYLDNAATTAPCREAIDAVNKGLEVFGNPSSLHRLGLDAELVFHKGLRWRLADACGFSGLSLGEVFEHKALAWKDWNTPFFTVRGWEYILFAIFVIGCIGGCGLAAWILSLRGLL